MVEFSLTETKLFRMRVKDSKRRVSKANKRTASSHWGTLCVCFCRFMNSFAPPFYFSSISWYWLDRSHGQTGIRNHVRVVGRNVLVGLCRSSVRRTPGNALPQFQRLGEFLFLRQQFHGVFDSQSRRGVGALYSVLFAKLFRSYGCVLWNRWHFPLLLLCASNGKGSV